VRGVRVAGAMGVSALLLLAAAAGAGREAPTPRLVGKFPTKLTVTYARSVLTHAGQHAVRMWTFAPRCASGGCATTLKRPSITPGSTVVFVYTLRPIGARQYKGTGNTVFDCTTTSGRRAARGAVERDTIVLNVTGVEARLVLRGGRSPIKVVAYKGTEHAVITPTAAGRSIGCVVGEQRATFTSLGR
jgi:hypothetical protein